LLSKVLKAASPHPPTKAVSGAENVVTVRDSIPAVSMEAITDKVFAKEPPFLPLSFILPLEETKKEVFGPAESSNNSVSNASESKVEAVNVNPSVTDLWCWKR